MITFAKHTAHLLSWIPKGQEEVLYISPNAFMEQGKPIRGGVPVCWPWFGNKKGQPSHGIARINEWRKRAENKFEFNTNEAKLILEVIEEDQKLIMKLSTTNTTFIPFEFTQALHTYFKVGDINKVSIEGHDGQQYYDKVLDDKGVQAGTLTFNGEFDRIYLTEEASVLIDPVLKRSLTITKKGSGSTVIWNPGPEKSVEMADMPNGGYLTMCCVEAANTHLDPITIKATETHVLIQEITLSNL